LAENNLRGEVRLTDNGLIGFYRNNYIMTLAGDTKAYLSPELISAYAKREPNPAYDVYRADVYSLGMTLLHCASLKEPELYFYNWPACSINQNNIKHTLNEARSRYSDRLIDLISVMLEVNPSTRPDFLTLDTQVRI
jgi:serine/threonine protein kinase